MLRVLVALVALAACSSSEPASAPAAGSGGGDAAALFSKWCTTCHGSTGRPNATMVARLGVRDLTDPAVRTRLTPAHVEQQIRRGSENKLMPGFEGALTDAQIKALAGYVASPAFVEPAR